MKLTKDMFHDWTDEGSDLEFDDELIIVHDSTISSVSIADEILSNQELMEQYKSTLDKIKTLEKEYDCDEFNDYHDKLRAILAKHDENTDTKSDLSKCIGMDKK